MKYKNKYFREVLEKDLIDSELGVNIHCKQDGIYITVPPYHNYGFETEILREDYDTERIVKAVQIVAKKYSIKVDLEKAIYGDNIKIKLKIHDE